MKTRADLESELMEARTQLAEAKAELERCQGLANIGYCGKCGKPIEAENLQPEGER